MSIAAHLYLFKSLNWASRVSLCGCCLLQHKHLRPTLCFVFWQLASESMRMHPCSLSFLTKLGSVSSSSFYPNMVTFGSKVANVTAAKMLTLRVQNAESKSNWMTPVVVMSIFYNKVSDNSLLTAVGALSAVHCTTEQTREGWRRTHLMNFHSTELYLLVVGTTWSILWG